MKRFFTKVIAVIIAIAIVAAGLYFANKKFNFLPTNNPVISSTVDTFNYKYVSSMDEEFVFTEYFDMKVPPECYVPSKEIVLEKYNTFADTAVITMNNIDILIQPYNIEAENTSEYVEKLRGEVIASYKERMPTVTFNEGQTFNVNGQYVSVLWFMTEYKEQATYTDIAFLEANGKLLTVTMNSANDYYGTQELFVAIINTIETK